MIIVNSIRTGLILFAFSCGTSLGAFSQSSLMDSETNLVLVPVTVMDHDGRFVGSLKAPSFRIFEDKRRQTIVSFQTTEMPISVVMLLDVSGSMLFDIRQLADAAGLLVEQLRPDDQVMVATFSDRTTTVREFSSVEEFLGREKIRLRVDGIPPVTMVYDAVEFGLKAVGRKKGKKAIVLLSDGIGEGIYSSAKSNLRMVAEGDAPVYVISFDTNATAKSKWESDGQYANRMKNAALASHFLQELADKSGGRRFNIESITDLRTTFRSVVSELSTQYLLGYSPDPPPVRGELRKISVSVDLPGTVVRSRNEVVFKK